MCLRIWSRWNHQVAKLAAYRRKMRERGLSSSSYEIISNPQDFRRSIIRWQMGQARLYRRHLWYLRKLPAVEHLSRYGGGCCVTQRLAWMRVFAKNSKSTFWRANSHQFWDTITLGWPTIQRKAQHLLLEILRRFMIGWIAISNNNRTRKATSIDWVYSMTDAKRSTKTPIYSGIHQLCGKVEE